MKLLLTDFGVRNASIRAALVDPLGKPITDALCIPIADYGGPDADPGGPWRFVLNTARARRIATDGHPSVPTALRC